MQRPTEKVAFAVQHNALCNTAVCALQCSMTKSGLEGTAAQYHRTEPGTIKCRISSISDISHLALILREVLGE